MDPALKPSLAVPAKGSLVSVNDPDDDGDPGDVRNGTWSIAASVWDSYGKLLMVLKAGSTFSALLLVRQDTSGDFASRQGLGLAGLGMARRRKAA